MRNLPIVALEFADEIDCCAGRRIISFGIESEGSPHGISPEKPGEARALSHSRSSISRNHPGSEIWIVHQALQCTDARPVVSLLQSGVRQFQAYGLIEIVAVVVSRSAHGIRIA